MTPGRSQERCSVRIDGRRVLAVVLTHGHNDHIDAAAALADTVAAPLALHPADRMLWDAAHPDRAPDQELADGDVLHVGVSELTVLHTPGHSPAASA